MSYTCGCRIYKHKGRSWAVYLFDDDPKSTGEYSLWLGRYTATVNTARRHPTMPKPTIFFVTGSYCLPSLYQPIFDGVKKAGFDIQSVHLPTVGLGPRQGREEQAPSMYDDAALIAKLVQELVDQGKDVIITGHSYGGIPMTECTKGLGKEERKASGKSGGIVELAYLAALLPPIGGSAKSLIDSMPKGSTLPVEIDVSIS